MRQAPKRSIKWNMAHLYIVSEASGATFLASGRPWTAPQGGLAMGRLVMVTLLLVIKYVPYELI